MSLKSKVVIVVVILLITTIVIIQNNKNSEKQQLNSVIKSNDKFSSMKSIAKPNWWMKPTVNSVTAQAKTKPLKRNAEPISNFLIMPDMDGWQLQENKTGIASATYSLNDTKNKHYELAIIRMNGQVTLEAILSIWQSKAGLTPDSSTISTTLDTKQKQRLDLFNFTGKKNTILVAVHKGEKNTFFRLSSGHKINQKSGFIGREKMERTFKDLLAEVYIFSK